MGPLTRAHSIGDRRFMVTEDNRSDGVSSARAVFSTDHPTPVQTLDTLSTGGVDRLRARIARGATNVCLAAMTGSLVVSGVGAFRPDAGRHSPDASWSLLHLKEGRIAFERRDLARVREPGPAGQAIHGEMQQSLCAGVIRQGQDTAHAADAGVRGRRLSHLSTTGRWRRPGSVRSERWNGGCS